MGMTSRAEGITAHVSLEHHAMSANFYVGLRDAYGDRRILSENGGWEKVSPGTPAAPTFRLDMEAAQRLFEEMWSQGFRSVHDNGNADKLDAARLEHLADLRKVAKLT